jgi:AraC-like DNA-binding protein
MRQVKNLYFEQRISMDLRVNFCGTELCLPQHSYGPAIRDYFIIHYIHSGRGVLKIKDKEYNLKKHDGFLVCPGVLHSYISDKDDPWHYSWIAFDGAKAQCLMELAGLSTETPIFTCDKDSFLHDIFLQMLSCEEKSAGREIKVLGLLHILISELANQSNICTVTKKDSKDIKMKEIFYERAQEFIAINYSRNISIQDICKYLGIGRTYLFIIFKEYAGISPQEFLILHRLNKAIELMPVKSLTIADISRSVGYEDPLQFSKIFKKVKGLSPKEFRQS